MRMIFQKKKKKITPKEKWIKYADIDLLGLFREEHLNTLT